MAKVTIFNQEYEPFQQVDWNFVKASQDSTANIHPYPARFINDIPRELIKLLSVEDDGLVLDPFCGSGTTMLEAQNAGLKSVGIDLNPIACLISQVRTSPIPPKFIETAEAIIEAANKGLDDKIEIPEIPNLDHWFKPEIQKAIASILYQINNLEDKDLSNALRLALSSIIVRMSNQESDTRYAAVENSHTGKDVFTGFSTACKKIELALSKYPKTKVKVICEDVLTVSKENIGGKVSLVITSPPYPNAYEYWLYHKYRMWWLGYDPIEVRSFEIGARPNYHKKNGQTAEDFEKQIFQVFDLFTPILKDNAHVCFVIGRSIIRGQEIDNASLITRVANAHGLALMVNIEREIASTKKSFNLKYGKIKTENILVFKKGTICE